jgi:Protein of unknown function (DUF669).
MANFEEILKKKSSEVNRPQAYPVGTYHCLVDGPFEPGKSSQKGTPYLRVRFKILAPWKGVDPKEAAEQQIVGKIITNDYYITDDSVYRLFDMCKDALGIEIGEEGTPTEKPLEEVIAEAPGKQVLVTLKHELSQDGKRKFHRLESTEHV